MFFLTELPSRRMIDGYIGKARVGNVDDISQALTMMRQASQLVRQLDVYFAAHDLSQLKYLILVVIDREPERQSLRQSEINKRLDVSKPVLHRTINSLLDAGMLNRVEDEDDGRAHLLALTEVGSKVLDEIMPGYFEIITDFMAELK